MNERIRELAEQAGFVDKGSNHTAYMSFDHEKFAQLIVKECAYIATFNQYQAFTPGYYVKKHFGVED